MLIFCIWRFVDSTVSFRVSLSNSLCTFNHRLLYIKTAVSSLPLYQQVQWQVVTKKMPQLPKPYHFLLLKTTFYLYMSSSIETVVWLGRRGVAHVLPLLTEFGTNSVLSISFFLSALNLETSWYLSLVLQSLHFSPTDGRWNNIYLERVYTKTHILEVSSYYCS